MLVPMPLYEEQVNVLVDKKRAFREMKVNLTPRLNMKQTRNNTSTNNQYSSNSNKWFRQFLKKYLFYLYINSIMVSKRPELKCSRSNDNIIIVIVQ